MDQILKIIAEYYGLTIAEIAKKGRTKHVVKARQMYFFFCRVHFPKRSLTSYTEHLFQYGDTLYDHSTVSHSYFLICNLKERYQDVREDVSNINDLILAPLDKKNLVVEDVNLVALCDRLVPSQKKYVL